jgi:hypothetical protein
LDLVTRFFRRNNRKEGLDWNLQMWFSPSRCSYLDFWFHKARPGRTGEVVGLRRAGLHVEVPNEIKEGSFMATSASLGGKPTYNMLFVASLWNNPMESPILASGWSCLSGFLSSNAHSISEKTRGRSASSSCAKTYTTMAGALIAASGWEYQSKGAGKQKWK